MSANIKLRVGGKEFSNFSAVSVDADVYQSASVFELQLAGKIITDDLRNKSCKLYINGKCELYGVVDSKELSWSKTDLATVMTGRSLMGLLVDAHSPIYGDVEADSLKALTEQLISKLPYIQQLLISYAGLSSTQAGKIKEWIEPGKTIFAVLSELAKRSGVVFYGMPDGGFYFDNLQYLKKPVFSITRRKDGTGNAIAGKRREDVSKLFSTITVLSTMQGNNAVHTSGLQSSYTLSVPDFPAADNGISFNKPFYTLDTSGLMTPQKAAQLIYDMQQRSGLALEYTVPGYTQNGRNWAINETCSIDDEINNVHGVYFIYGRKFTLSKTDGSLTELRLSKVVAQQ